MTDNELEELFPQCACIADGSLRQKAQRAMRLAAQRGGWDWESILKCPVTLNWTECPVTWVEHVRDVTDACIQAFAQQEKYFRQNHVPVSRDLVVAGALLHDIGKLTEFAHVDNQVCHSRNYQLLRHPLSGAVIAHEAGLPCVGLTMGHTCEPQELVDAGCCVLCDTIDDLRRVLLG